MIDSALLGTDEIASLPPREGLEEVFGEMLVPLDPNQAKLSAEDLAKATPDYRKEPRDGKIQSPYRPHPQGIGS